MKSTPKVLSLAMAVSLLAMACGSTLDDVVTENLVTPEVPESAAAPDQQLQSGDDTFLVEDSTRDEDSIESPVGGGPAAGSEEPLGTRFTWCAEMQAEWDALDEAADRYLSAADTWLDVEIEVLGITDALDLAEAESLADLERQQLESRRSELDDAARAVGDRLHASAWASSKSEVGGEFNLDLIRYWQSLFGSDAVPFDTEDRTLEVAYERAWQEFINAESVPDLVAGFYLYYLSFELGGETYGWRMYMETIGSALESAKNEYYDVDSFADTLRSDIERVEDVDAYLREAYNATQSILESESSFLVVLNGLETALSERLPSSLSDEIIDETIQRAQNWIPAFQVTFNFIGAQTALEAYERTLSQQSSAETLLAQEAVFDEFDRVIFGLNQEPSIANIDRPYQNYIYDGFEELVSSVTLLPLSSYSEIQEKQMKFEEQLGMEFHRLSEVLTPAELASQTVDFGSTRRLLDPLRSSDISNGVLNFEAFQESMRESCRLPS